MQPLKSNVEAEKEPHADPHCGLPQGKSKRCVFISMNRQHHGLLQTARPQLYPGYRVYFSRRAEVVYLLLVGGDKSSQKRDIKRAIEMARALDKE